MHLAVPVDRDRAFLEATSSALVTIRVSSATDGTTTIHVEGRLARTDLPDPRVACESAYAPWHLAGCGKTLRIALPRPGLLLVGRVFRDIRIEDPS
jgi:hypothetical protein